MSSSIQVQYLLSKNLSKKLKFHKDWLTQGAQSFSEDPANPSKISAKK